MKNRTPIPQLNKVRAVLQQEINSECPFCSNEDVAHFDIHHIDKIRNNHKIENLLLVCKICHSKIHCDEISFQEVINAKFKAKNCNSNIQFISTTIDSENCGWEPIVDVSNAFKIDNTNKSAFPILNFNFINNFDNTILLTSVKLISKILPIGLSGPAIKDNCLKPSAFFEMKISHRGTIENLILKDELIILPKMPAKIQILLYSQYEEHIFAPKGKYVLSFNFKFNNDFCIDIPDVLLNCKNENEKLQHIGYN
jgi:hypothetical protein